MLSAAAREIGAGRLDQRVEPQSNDEFGSLVEAFNAMAGELAAEPPQGRALDASSSSASTARSKDAAATSKRFSSASRPAWCRSTRPARSPRSTAPRRGCSSLDRTIVGQPAPAVFDRADLQPLGALLAGAGARHGASRRRRRSRCRATARSCTSPRSRRRSSATAARPKASVLVLDDVTPLIRAQKVAAWREVARRLAHEIKNPLTPIQLSRRAAAAAFRAAPPPARKALVDECTDDDRRRGRVAEGAGRRVLAVRAHAVAAHGADRPGAAHRPTRSRSTTASSPTCASSSGSRRACRSCGSTPSRSAASSSTWWTTRSRRWSAAAQIVVETQLDAANSVVRVVVADNGPGIPAGGAREAVPAVLLDQAARQRPRPGDRPAHHRRARRQHRRRRQHAARHAVYNRAAVLTTADGAIDVSRDRCRRSPDRRSEADHSDRRRRTGRAHAR